jgi:hypothetical protein
MKMFREFTYDKAAIDFMFKTWDGREEKNPPEIKSVLSGKFVKESGREMIPLIALL